MKKILISLVVTSVVLSCTNDSIMKQSNNVMDNNSFNDISYVLSSNGQTILGDKFEIPYSVENLIKALDNLPTETKSMIDPNEIYATHYYVRFHPKNLKELDLLENIKPKLMLSEIPLDREVLQGGHSYHDPTLPDDMPTYQYTTLEANYYERLKDTLSVESEILIPAYMPDYYTNVETKTFSTSIPNTAMQKLLEEAYKLTGHEYIPETKASEWHPMGTIKAYDDITGYAIPIAGVCVRGVRLLTIKETMTNSEGVFYFSETFKNKVNMKVIWEGTEWDVREGQVSQATYEGPQIENERWDLEIKSSEPYQVAFAAIHRGAYRYYIGYKYGLTRPDNSRREKLVYKHDGIAGGTNGDYNLQWGMGIFGDIRIAGQNEFGRRPASHILSTTLHELAHATHYTNASSIFRNSETRVIESWARFAQYLLTKRIYKDYGIDYLTSDTINWSGLTYEEPDIYYNFQATPNTKYEEYTTMFIDLYDDFNQYEFYKNADAPNDKIKNFPPSKLEQIVFSSTTFAQVVSKLKELSSSYSGTYYNMTEENIDLLFDIYL